MIGQYIAHYRITAKLGEGGMGEVYRATDTKLSREVAIKILPERFAHDPDRMARFRLEAKILAALNHPNIATIHGVEDLAIVMELVEGKPLKGPLPAAQALPLALQIVNALECAHEKGIVHRDLKPANVMVLPDGTAKVLDFGLAKLAMEGRPPALDTVTMLPGSETGVVMGTLAYMSPEQARGGAVDKRTDIWSFGVLLFELTVGQKPFSGKTPTDYLASILTQQPDFGLVPPSLRRLVRLCLEKDPKQRLRDIGDVRLALTENTGGEPAEAPRAGLGWKAAVGLLILALTAALWALWRQSPVGDPPLMRLTEDLGPDAELSPRLGGGAIISPDGERLVYTSRTTDGRLQLSTRRFVQPRPSVLAGTEDAAYPFFSPDGKWVGFFAGSRLVKVSVDDGAVVSLCNAPNGRGGSWGEDGNIVAALNVIGGLSRVPSSGGVPEPLTRLSGDAQENSHRWPQILRGGKAVLFTAGHGGGILTGSHIEVQSLDSGRRVTLHHGGLFGRYLPTGHLAFVENGILLAAPMDTDRLVLTGPPFPVAEDVLYDPAYLRAMFDFSRTGALIFVNGTLEAQKVTIHWLDGEGRTQPLLAKPGRYARPRFSPDGKRLAFVLADGGEADIWTYDIARENATRLTFTPGVDEVPSWAPDGAHLIYRSPKGISWTRADGSGEPVLLFESKYPVFPFSFSPDGRWLAYVEANPDNGWDIWTVAMEGSGSDQPAMGKAEIFLRTPASEGGPSFSPDGRWIAYFSDESGRNEVYVRPFRPSGPGNGGKWQVSSEGGHLPIWSLASPEIFYLNSSGQIATVSYSASGNTFSAGRPRVWLEERILSVGVTRSFDLAPDGKRFAVFKPPPGAGEKGPPTRVTYLLNFFDDLRRRTAPRH